MALAAAKAAPLRSGIKLFQALGGYEAISIHTWRYIVGQKQVN